MSLNASWELKIKSRAYKELSKLPLADRNKIIQVGESLSFNPYSGDVKKMKGEANVWRRRIGAYRIFYEIIADGKVIYVYKIERRASKTY